MLKFPKYFIFFFHSEINELNYTGVWILDSISHITLKVLWNLVSGVQSSIFCHIYPTLLWQSLCNFNKICKPLVVDQFCMALYHSKTCHHMIKDSLKFTDNLNMHSKQWVYFHYFLKREYSSFMVNPFPAIHDNCSLLCHLLMYIYCKQFGPRSDCSHISSLIKVKNVWHGGFGCRTF